MRESDDLHAGEVRLLCRLRCAILLRMGKLFQKIGGVREDTRLPLQALRYGVAAFAGFAADYLALLLLKETAGLHYLVAVPVAFVVGIAVNYLIGVTFVFHRGNHSVRLELSLFLAISLSALAVTELSMYLLTDLLDIDYRISRVLSGVVTYLFNFCSRRYILYREKNTDE
jgi:putative flippase GtrA